MDAEQLLETLSTEETQELAAALPEVVFTAEAVRRGFVAPFMGAAATKSTEMSARADEAEGLILDTGESLAEQLRPAYKGYRAVVDGINGGRDEEYVLTAATEESVAAEFKAWFTDDKLALVVAAQEFDPRVRFTLVATPNILAKSRDIAYAAARFGYAQPRAAYIWEDLYDTYSAELLSGTNPDSGNNVQFSLIPSSYTPGMKGNAVMLRAMLARIQADHPEMKVPSALDAVTYWQTLRAQGECLNDDTAFDRTHINHFDLPARPGWSRGWTAVPSSRVHKGEPRLTYSYPEYACDGRIAVG